MSKRINVILPIYIKEIFIRSLRNYTDVAFPAGGADCALVARESLLDSLADLEREYAEHQDGRTSYNKRLRAMIKEAIRLHYQLAAADLGHVCTRECALMLEVAEGVVHSDAELMAARRADAHAP